MNHDNPRIVKAKNLKKGDHVVIAGVMHVVKSNRKNGFGERDILLRRYAGLTNIKVRLVMTRNTRITIAHRKK